MTVSSPDSLGVALNDEINLSLAHDIGQEMV